MTHDYKRNGTTTLFAALDVLNGTIIGRCMTQHRHQELIRFLAAVERAVPAGKVIPGDRVNPNRPAVHSETHGFAAPLTFIMRLLLITCVLASDKPKGRLSLQFPSSTVDILVPRLFPET